MRDNLLAQRLLKRHSLSYRGVKFSRALTFTSLGMAWASSPTAHFVVSVVAYDSAPGHQRSHR
jgi:hypothetical protein